MTIETLKCNNCQKEVGADTGWLAPFGHGYRFLCSPCRWGEAKVGGSV